MRANPASHARSLLIYGSDSMCVLILVGNLICWLSESTFFVIVLDQKLLKHAGKDIKQSPVEKIVSFSDVYTMVETKLKELVTIYARAGREILMTELRVELSLS